MNVTEAIVNRRSIRRWKPIDVEREKIIKVLNAGRMAPSWANIQPWRFIVVQELDHIQSVAMCTGGKLVVKTAPVIIVACYKADAFTKDNQRESLINLVHNGALDLSENGVEVALGNPYQAPHTQGECYMLVKTGEQVMIALSYMTLEAINQGLGTCWIGTVAPDLHQDLGIPEELILHSLLALGYPDESPLPRPRKKLNEIVSWETYP